MEHSYGLNIVNATMAKGPVGNGVTEPYHIICSGEQYIVKFAQNPQSERVLVNEFVCAKLAIKLELPIPEAVIVKISNEFLLDHPELNELNVKPGLHFGSKKIRKAMPVTNPSLLKAVSNSQIIPDILLFDHLICNKDRGSNLGNLLIDLSNKELNIIDHTHVFELGSIWDETQLRRRIGDSLNILDLSGPVYTGFINLINGYNPFHSILNKIYNLSEADITEAIWEIPDEWSCNQIEKEILFEYIYNRKSRIKEFLPLLQPRLPFWKGGAEQ